MSQKRRDKEHRRAKRKRDASMNKRPKQISDEAKAERDAAYIENADYRYEFITSIAKDAIGPAGVLHKKGAPVELSAKITLRDGKILFFPMPSMVGMYLNMANAAYVEAQALYDRIKLTEKKSAPGNYHIKSGPDAVQILFDLFERRIASVVFAFSALEAFANETIPTDFEYTRVGKKSTELFKKEQIERWVPIEEKLVQILPQVCGVASPVAIQSWNVFKQLKKERDRLIHLKHRDMFEGMHVGNGEAIWDTLASDLPVNYAVELRSLFEHYYPSAEARKRWMRKAPYWG